MDSRLAVLGVSGDRVCLWRRLLDLRVGARDYLRRGGLSPGSGSALLQPPGLSRHHNQHLCLSSPGGGDAVSVRLQHRQPFGRQTGPFRAHCSDRRRPRRLHNSLQHQTGGATGGRSLPLRAGRRHGCSQHVQRLRPSVLLLPYLLGPRRLAARTITAGSHPDRNSRRLLLRHQIHRRPGAGRRRAGHLCLHLAARPGAAARIDELPVVRLRRGGSRLALGDQEHLRNRQSLRAAIQRFIPQPVCNQHMGTRLP